MIPIRRLRCNIAFLGCRLDKTDIRTIPANHRLSPWQYSSLAQLERTFPSLYRLQLSWVPLSMLVSHTSLIGLSAVVDISSSLFTLLVSSLATVSCSLPYCHPSAHVRLLIVSRIGCRVLPLSS